MNYSSSFNNLYKIIQQSTSQEKDNKVDDKKKIGYLSSRIIKILISFTNILKTCEGRDKLCAFIQYSSKFYSTIIYHAIDLESATSSNVEDPFLKHDALKNVEKSMSSGRKIFRFLKWLEDIKSIYYYIVYKTPSMRNIFKALMHLSSMFYHIFDNLVWSSNVGVISEYFVGDIKLKNTKNSFSLLRNLIKIVMDINKFKSLYVVNKKNEEEVYEEFEKNVENFKTHLHSKLLTQMIEVRGKLRRKVLDIIHSTLRICMLIYSLKFEPFYSNLHPILAGFCGMVHSVISLYKVLYDNKDCISSTSTFKKTLSGLGRGKTFEKGKMKKRKSLEEIIDEMDEVNNETTILDYNYFINYYVDFNKDFPTDPRDIISKGSFKLKYILA